MVEDDILIKAKNYASSIRTKYKPIRILLFGSHVKGNNHPDSDIDIAVVLDDYKDKLDLMLELMRLRRSIDFNIEPHPFRLNEFIPNNFLVAEILKNSVDI